MTDVYSQEVRGMPREHQQRPWGGPRDNHTAKVEGSTSANGGFRFGISGTTVTGTVTALTVVTPFIVLFSPILVSVFVIMFLLATGFFTAREVGVAAKTGLARMYKYVTDANRNRIQEDSFDQETNKFGLRVREMKDRDERLSEGGRYETGGFDTTIEAEESSHNLVKATTSATTGTSLVVFSGLTFIGTVIALVLATPPLVIFSPVLMPALITMFLLASGFVSSGGFGVAAASVLAWTYRYATKGPPTETSHMIGSKPQLSRKVETRMFGSKPQESRNEETHMFGSKSGDQGHREESRKPDSKMWETRDRDEQPVREGRYPTRGVYETIETQGGNYQVAKVATATTVGGSLLVLSGLTFIGTVIGLTLATPLMVIFSPVLVPAMITVFLLASGLFASGGFSVAAVTTLGWLYKYVTNKNPRERNLFDWESGKQGSTHARMDEHVGEEGYRVTNRDRVSPASHHQV